jgi:cytochrome c oxidase cbb3-type subunit III
MNPNHTKKAYGRLLRGVLVPAIACACVSAAGCGDHMPGDSAARSALPPMQTPVGPIPGPERQPARPRNPYHDERGGMAEGRTLFVHFNCVGCHGGRAGGGMAPSLRDVEWLYGDNDAQIFNSIAQGRDQGMPAWGTKLNEDQIWKLVAYIKSLRTPDEPNPPS